MAGSIDAIIDASGNAWTITSGGQVATNGAADTVTSNVTELAYVNGTIWQENTDSMWWGEAAPDSAWANTPGTATSPLGATTTAEKAVAIAASADGTVVMAGSIDAITDASGNAWTITSGGQVATNGAADTVTSNVTEIAYVSGTIWQENTDNMWWGETAPDSAWANTPGTATNPLAATAIQAAAATTSSASGTVVMAGSGGTPGMIGSFADNQALAAMTTALGAAPVMGLTYVDSAQPISNFVASAQYEAATFAGKYGANAIPLLGLPMAGAGENADADFQAIANGSQDGMINGVLQAYADQGYKSFVLRPGFEMNGGWFSWTVTDSNAADFVAAFQRIATLAHNFQGASVSVDFNPNFGTSIALQNYYPGNAYVDSIGMDIYGSPWNNDTIPTGTNGSPTYLTLDYLMQFAKDNGKPFALPETGAGTTDTLFPQQLLQAIQTANMPIAFVGFWDTNDINNAQWTDDPAATAAWVAVANQVKQPSGGAASTSAITDASGNKWSITADGQVAINGAVDAVTANVTELAYVNGEVWQQAGGTWWGETQPDDSWGPGTTISPLTQQIIIPPTDGTTIVSLSQISVEATAGNQMLLISGSGNTVALSGGTDTITDTGGSNRYVLPAAGNGSAIFTTNILTANDTLDLTTALAATDWNGDPTTLPNYLKVTNTAQGAQLAISATSNGSLVVIASINGATTANLTSVLAHAVT
jgi:hypothetical protein